MYDHFDSGNCTSKSLLQRPSATMQRLLQHWKARARSQIGSKPRHSDKAERATILGRSGPESHSSCAFQGSLRCPKPSQREGFERSILLSSPSSPSWLYWGMNSARFSKKEVLCRSLTYAFPNAFVLLLSKPLLRHCQNSPDLAFTKLRYCYQ